MTTKARRNLGLAAMVLWIVVLGYGVRGLFVDDGDDWELAYSVFSLALPIAAALTLGLLASATRGCERPRLRVAGLAVGALGCALAGVGAWALPVWMTTLAAAYALIALASRGAVRRSIVLIAAGLAAGVAFQLTSLQFGLDEDAAANFALTVATLTVLAGLASGLSRFVEGDRVEDSTAPRGVVPAQP